MDHFIKDIDIISSKKANSEEITNVSEENSTGKAKKLYIESYGCQMNFSDSEIVSSIMANDGFDTTDTLENADVIFLNTCSIREKAEQTVRNRLAYFNSLKRNRPALQVGILGCMAERLKSKLLEEEKIVDLVAGPDAYRDLPNLVKRMDEGQMAINTFLSREETYADITPVRLDTNGVTAFISIMRGCDNMCSFCVVPFTRGRERSRDPETIVNEARELFDRGYREVTLLGQNVDSYKWKEKEEMNFEQLLEKVALISPELRVRFSTSHPKDITDEVLQVIARFENICNNIHLPAQSGSSRILKLMNRTYNREWYLDRVRAIREIIGDECGISSDFIAGFCTETEEEHLETLTLMDEVQYDFSYMFIYSERPGTLAARKLKDDIPEEIKKRRLSEIIEKQQKHSLERNQRDVSKIHKVLIEGYSRRSKDFLQGRNSSNKVVVFPKQNNKKGEYVNVRVSDCTAATLMGTVVKKND